MVAKRVLQLPPRGQWVFVVMSELMYIYTYTAHHPVYVCVCVCAADTIVPRWENAGRPTRDKSRPRGKLK